MNTTDELVGVDKGGIEFFRVDNAKHPHPLKPDEGVELFVVYGPTTSDYPGKYVVRRNIAIANRVDVDRSPYAIGKTLKSVLRHLPSGLKRLDRHGSDDPVIVEVWI